MTFYSDLYLGEGVGARADEIIENIKQNKVMPEVYVISVATVPGNLFDLIPQWELTQKAYPKEDIRVIGLAMGKAEAINLIQYVIEEAVKEANHTDLSQYFFEKWEGQTWK